MAEASEFLAINRPDLYTQETVLAKNPKGVIPKLKKLNIIDTFVIIVLSGLIFITLFSYADVIRSYIDSIHINNVIKSQTKSRFYFAIVSTVITILACLIAFIIYKIFNLI